MKIVPFDYIFEIPEAVVVCPYCQQKMYADVQGWTEDQAGFYTASSIKTSCNSQPDIEDDEFPNYVASHSDMPYVYLFPVINRIEDYINNNFRFTLIII